MTGRVVWCVLAACWIVRLLGARAETTALWGINASAYLPAWFSWTTLALLGAALFRPFGAVLTRGLEHLGRRYERPSASLMLEIFGVVAFAMLCLPDRVGFTGDFLLRLSSAKATGSPDAIFPQAMPLDLWLHYTVPHELARLQIAPVEVTTRLLGAVEAGCLALLVVTLVRGSGVRGAAFASASLVILAGAPLAMFAGLNKAFTELIVVAVALAASTFPRSSSSGRTLATLSIFALALALHRAALVLTPIVALQVLSWLKTAARVEPRWRLAAGQVMLLVVLLLAGLALVPVVRMDLPRGLVWLLHRGWSMSLGVRMVDLANLVAFLAPSVVLGAAVLLDRRVRKMVKGPWRLWYACLAIPSVLLIGVVDAPQGYFRDWDMFAIGGVLLSIVGALVIGLFLTVARESVWLAGAVVLSTLMPSAHVFALQSDEEAGLRRVAAFAQDSRRSTILRASVLGFLGKRAWDTGDLPSAGTYGRRAAELVPSRTMLTLWAEAEEGQGRYSAAESAYVRLVETSPGYLRGWLGLARIRVEAGEPLEAAAAAESALAIQPGSTEAAELLRTARAGSR